MFTLYLDDENIVEWNASVAVPNYARSKQYNSKRPHNARFLPRPANSSRLVWHHNGRSYLHKSRVATIWPDWAKKKAQVISFNRDDRCIEHHSSWYALIVYSWRILSSVFTIKSVIFIIMFLLVDNNLRFFKFTLSWLLASSGCHIVGGIWFGSLDHGICG